MQASNVSVSSHSAGDRDLPRAASPSQYSHSRVMMGDQQVQTNGAELFDTLSLAPAAVDVDETDAVRKARLEEEYGIDIYPSNKTGYQYKIMGENLTQAFRFKSLSDLEIALRNGYLRRTAKGFSLLKRLITGRDVHNAVEPLLKSQNSRQPTLFIDGGDDIAISLESSKLSRNLVLSLQTGMLYPSFMAVVFIGWQGADQGREDARAEYSELLEKRLALREELLSEMATAMAVEQGIKNYLLQNKKDNEASQINDEIAVSLMSELIQATHFKTNLLLKIQKLAASSSEDDVETLQKQIDEAKNLISLLATHNARAGELPIPKESLINEVLASRISDSFNPVSVECQEFIMKLAEYQENQDQQFHQFCESFVAAPFLSSGLSIMFWGMAAYQIRALTELIGGSAVGGGAIESIGLVGDYFNVIGQAQLALAGLVKLGLSVHEAKSTTEWINIIENSELFAGDDAKLQQIKEILSGFNRANRCTQIVDGLGGGFLTLGQLGMILGSGLALGINALLPASVGLVIAGVGMSIAASQYANRVLNIAQEPTQKEIDIAKSVKEDLGFFENIQDRINQLYDLSQENAKTKIWADIYRYILKNPNKSADQVLTRFVKKYQKYDDNAKGHYRHLYRSGLDFILGNTEGESALAKIEKAILLVKERKSEAFVEQVVEHITEVQGNEPLGEDVNNNVFALILKLMRFAEKEGFSNDLNRRMVKRLINKNGYAFRKEQKPDYQAYITPIETLKDKRPWRIINPLSVFSNLAKLGINGVKYLWHRNDPIAQENDIANMVYSQKYGRKFNWGTKKSVVYAFNSERFTKDLLEAASSPDDERWQELKSVCKIMFTENLASRPKDWVGRDTRDVFAETMRHIYRKLNRDRVLRPVIYGVSDQIKLAEELKTLLCQVPEGMDFLAPRPEDELGATGVDNTGFAFDEDSFLPERDSRKEDLARPAPPSPSTSAVPQSEEERVSYRLKTYGLTALWPAEISRRSLKTLYQQVQGNFAAVMDLAPDQMEAFIGRILYKRDKYQQRGQPFSPVLQKLLLLVEQELKFYPERYVQKMLKQYVENPNLNLSQVFDELRAARLVATKIAEHIVEPVPSNIAELTASKIALLSAKEILAIEVKQIAQLNHEQGLALSLMIQQMSTTLADLSPLHIDKLKQLLAALRERVLGTLRYVYKESVQGHNSLSIKSIQAADLNLFGQAMSIQHPVAKPDIQGKEMDPALFVQTKFEDLTLEQIQCLNLDSILSMSDDEKLAWFNQVDTNAIVNCRVPEKVWFWLCILKFLYFKTETASRLHIAIEQHLADLRFEWLSAMTRDYANFSQVRSLYANHMDSITKLTHCRLQSGDKPLRLSSLSAEQISTLSAERLQQTDLTDIAELDASKAQAYANALGQKIKANSAALANIASSEFALYQRLCLLHCDWVIRRRALALLQGDVSKAAAQTIEAIQQECASL